MTPQIAPTQLAGLDAKVQADQADLLHANVAGNMAGNISATLVAVWMLAHESVPAWAFGIWVAAQFGLSALALAAVWRVRRRPTTARNAQRRVRAAGQGSLLFGLLWAAGVFLLWQPGRLEQQVLLMFLIVGLTSGALHAQMASPRAFLAFFIPCLLSVVANALREPGVHGAVIVLSVLVYGLASSRVAVLMHRTLIDSLRRRHEIEHLAADLKVQKELAEEANRSKSRFLAAASHDLRQPVHALALLVGALGHRPLEPDAARLVGLVQGTVAGMGDMFNALLDVSQLDAGSVTVQPRDFALRPLLERIARDEGELARAKGLTLRLRCATVLAHSDPVLVERILRNLVANAVRYTESGGVLVAASGRGSQVVVRVVDTGIGIPPESQAEVFDEFVQLHNPERDRTRGLGLGLAIVHRLAKLLELRLALRSQPGRGTTFTLRLASAAAALQDADAPTAPAALPLPARASDLVLVIDDDANTRAAMESLLAAWGYDTLAAAGLADLTPRLMPLRAAPSLVISDLRLRGAERGTDLVAQLRELFNEALPAILITGDTAPDRLQEAKDSGLFLLHKPVSAAALRGAIASALAAPPGAAG